MTRDNVMFWILGVVAGIGFGIMIASIFFDEGPSCRCDQCECADTSEQETKRLDIDANQRRIEIVEGSQDAILHEDGSVTIHGKNVPLVPLPAEEKQTQATRRPIQIPMEHKGNGRWAPPDWYMNSRHVGNGVYEKREGADE